MTEKQTPSGAQSETPRNTAGGKGVDLSCLCDMHPRLPGDMAGVMMLRAALGLQRNSHSPGVELQMAIESVGLRCALTWLDADLGTMEQHDSKRITEDGAEAIALAVAFETKDWRVVRRLQQGENADWLLEHQDKDVRKLVAFEVSGTDNRSIKRLLRDKLDQVSKSADVDQRCAGVVGFKQPQVALQSVKKVAHGS